MSALPKMSMDPVAKYFLDRGASPETYQQFIEPQIEVVDPSDRAWYRSFKHSEANALGRLAIAITYLNPRGEPYVQDGVPFKVLRFVGEPRGMLDPTAKVPKMSNPYGRPPEVHFPRLVQGAYADAAQGTPLAHVESGVKAMILYYMTGTLAAGLCGVYTFGARKSGIELTHSYLRLDFGRFKNIILFDSNTDTNADVGKAQDLFAYNLRQVLRCREVFIAKLPKQPNGDDWGPDDYLSANGPQAILGVLNKAEPYAGLAHAELVNQVNERAVYVRDTDMVAMLSPKMLKSREQARAALATVNKPLINEKSGRITYVEGFEHWLRSPIRAEVDAVGYRYLGEDRYEVEGRVHLNLYTPGTGVWPVGTYRPEDSGLLRACVAQCIGDADDLDLFWRWFRFIKFTDRKPVTYLIMYSHLRGIGKGWIASLVAAVLGQANSTIADAQDFSGGFNSILVGKRFVALNEFKCNPGDREAVREGIKNAVGDKQMRAERKYHDAAPVDFNAGVLITTNALENVPTDGLDDRRAVPICCDGTQGGEKWIGPQYADKWAEVHRIVDGTAGQEGQHQLEALAWYLHERVQPFDFSTWRPPVDDKRIQQLGQGLAPVAQAALKLRLRLVDEQLWERKRCYRMAEVITLLSQVYGLDRFKMPTPATMGKHLRDAGWLHSKSVGVGDPAKDGRVGTGKTRTDSGVWFPCEEATYERGGRLSTERAGEHAFADIEQLGFGGSGRKGYEVDPPA